MLAGLNASAWFPGAGLFVLMATPGLRVGIAVVEAVRSRDWFFVLVTAAVILLLALSAALAFVSN